MKIFDFTEGSTPLLVSLPHCGLRLPQDIAAGMTPEALNLADTDWHVDRLYGFARELGASIIRPHYSRYVIDLNRPADDGELYPGNKGTSLCPTMSFSEEPLYKSGQQPDRAEVKRRLTTWWQPYHSKLQAELIRLKGRYGVAVLFEAHSIRSQLPYLFSGTLPDINIGTAAGVSCAAGMRSELESVLLGQDRYAYVIDQRFKGGYITRAYGAPQQGIHSIQLELAQRNYMEEHHPFTYLPDSAAHLQPLLKRLLQGLIDWAQREVESA